MTNEELKKNDLRGLKTGDKVYHTCYGVAEIYRPDAVYNDNLGKIHYRMIAPPQYKGQMPSYSTSHPVDSTGRNGGPRSNPVLFKSLQAAIAYFKVIAEEEK